MNVISSFHIIMFNFFFQICYHLHTKGLKTESRTLEKELKICIYCVTYVLLHSHLSLAQSFLSSFDMSYLDPCNITHLDGAAFNTSTPKTK